VMSVAPLITSRSDDFTVLSRRRRLNHTRHQHRVVHESDYTGGGGRDDGGRVNIGFIVLEVVAGLAGVEAGQRSDRHSPSWNHLSAIVRCCVTRYLRPMQLA